MRQRAAATKEVALGAAALVLIALAVLLYLQAGRADMAPADKFVRFNCPRCQKSFELSEREIDAIWEKHEYQLRPGERDLRFRCKHCGEMTAERAVEPPAHTSPDLPPDPTSG